MGEKIYQLVKLGILEVTGCADLKCGDKLLSDVITNDLEALLTAHEKPLREAIKVKDEALAKADYALRYGGFENIAIALVEIEAAKEAGK